MYTARELAALTFEYIIAGNRDELRKRLSLPFTANKDTHPCRTFLHPTIYNHNDGMLNERTPNSICLQLALYASCLLEKH